MASSEWIILGQGLRNTQVIPNGHFKHHRLRRRRIPIHILIKFTQTCKPVRPLAALIQGSIFLISLRFAKVKNTVSLYTHTYQSCQVGLHQTEHVLFRLVCVGQHTHTRPVIMTLDLLEQWGNEALYYRRKNGSAPRTASVWLIFVSQLQFCYRHITTAMALARRRLSISYVLHWENSMAR